MLLAEFSPYDFRETNILFQCLGSPFSCCIQPLKGVDPEGSGNTAAELGFRVRGPHGHGEGSRAGAAESVGRGTCQQGPSLPSEGPGLTHRLRASGGPSWPGGTAAFSLQVRLPGEGLSPPPHWTHLVTHLPETEEGLLVVSSARTMCQSSGHFRGSWRVPVPPWMT